MPIRFRCAYCNQLMGISRKKAGTVVRCPKCAGEIIVPKPEGEPEPEEPAYQQAGPGVLEDVNIEQLLNQPNGAGTAAAPADESVPAPPPIAAMPPETAPPPPAPPEPPRRLGLFLPMGMIIVSIGVVILLLILMFVLGLIIGRATMIPKTTALHPRLGATPTACVLLSPLSPPWERGRG